MFAVPLKLTPPILRAVSKAVAVPALPVMSDEIVAGSLASATVPLAKLEAFKLVKLLALNASMLPLASRYTAFSAG